MEGISDISDLLDRCKDRAFLSNNREKIREVVMRPPLKEQARSLLGTKKNVFVIKLIEATDIPSLEVIPCLADKRNINQYVYSTYYHLYRIGLIEKAVFEKAREDFKCMKNYEKMFEDTRSSFIISKIESDRRKDKIMKRELSRVVDVRDEIKSLKIELPEISCEEVMRIEGVVRGAKNVFVIDLDSIFDIKWLRCQAKEEAVKRISDIRDILFCIDRGGEVISTLGDVGERHAERSYNGRSMKDIKGEKYYKLERVFNGPEKLNFICTPLFYMIDRLMKNRITRLYDSIVKLYRMKQSVYLVSTCSLSQVLAELLFFEYSCVDIKTVISVSGNVSAMYEDIQKKDNARIVCAGGGTYLSSDRVDVYRIEYENFRKMVDDMLDVWSEKGTDHEHGEVDA
ncbi:hypothetical protein CWI42_021860 [Ordospora colligata]|uniref:Uncharacterized protein n=1 Tax=Ordospora colligata OC4 TaxID=1354746 RepID=A0A0B2UMR4_9MICR|nr:uncharacterized protein M896_021870 [Ordospora colligata OC4]KHN70347.1 hypothetical protein M896_021870 [Ordospora colligata OC4]TBU16891.1 hypothetical protein CWI41_021880 [Ordospora colligata]TBU19440.1 hypothetical protein CWI42_021860 [Ordospora colligata]